MNSKRNTVAVSVVIIFVHYHYHFTSMLVSHFFQQGRGRILMGHTHGVRLECAITKMCINKAYRFSLASLFCLLRKVITADVWLMELLLLIWNSGGSTEISKYSTITSIVNIVKSLFIFVYLCHTKFDLLAIIDNIMEWFTLFIDVHLWFRCKRHESRIADNSFLQDKLQSRYK